MQMILQFLSVLMCAIFTGAAIYINVVEHPVRISCGIELAVIEWRVSYKRATLMQAPLAIAGFIFAFFSWLSGSNIIWLIGGFLLVLVVPYTLIFMMPTNKRLEDKNLDINSNEAHLLLSKWGKLHAIRSVISAIALIIFLLNPNIHMVATFDLLNLIIQLLVAIGTISLAMVAYLEMKAAITHRQQENNRKSKMLRLHGRRIHRDLRFLNYRIVSENINSYLERIELLELDIPELAECLRDLARVLEACSIVKDTITQFQEEHINPQDPEYQDALTRGCKLGVNYQQLDSEARRYLEEPLSERETKKLQKIIDEFNSDDYSKSR